MTITPNLSVSRSKERPTASCMTCLVGAIFPIYLGVANLLWKSPDFGPLILGAVALASGGVIALSGLMLCLRPEQHKIWSATAAVSSLGYWTGWVASSYLWYSSAPFEIFYFLLTLTLFSGLPYMMIAGIFGYRWKPRN